MTPLSTILLCTAAPLAAFFLALVVFRRQPAVAAAVSLLGGATSLVAALALLRAGPSAEPLMARWFEAGGTPMMFGFLLDGPNLLMGAIVAAIALLIQIYSLGYMSGDPGRSRYFALMSFFAWSMLSFVYAASLLQTFVFWELVGLASFLLIGFWYEKPAAAAAARKAFVMTRIGDVGLFLGLILLLQATGTLEIARINDPALLAQHFPGARGTLIALLLFSGIVGKSAQFPLHTWLPDAMEGPTPVSALLHSATMVAAGVFLYARFFPLFFAAGPDVTRTVVAIALFTALLSATVAMVQLDIKRVLAYSSISQLGFMLAGLGAGSLHAGVFHLTTHAFFKALLFLCAGAYIHHHGTNDMVAIGRAGGRTMRWTTVGLVVGGAALAGIPPFAGFFSKEAIIGALGAEGMPRVFVGGAYLASFLTAYYTFRMVLLVTRPNPQGLLAPEEPAGAHVEHHAHGSDAPWSMRGPIVLLTLASAVAGFGGDWIAALLGTHAAHPPLAEMAPAIGVALAGALLAWVEYGRRGATQIGFIARVPALQTLFVRKWFIDELYQGVVARLLLVISRASALFEVKGLDALSDGVASATLGSGRLTARAQTGRLQLYIGTAVLLMAVFCYFIGTL